MVLTLHDIPKLLNIIKLYENKEFASSRNYVQRTFNDEPIKEARFPNYLEIEKFCSELNLVKIESGAIFLTEIGKKILTQYKKQNMFDDKTKEILIHECLLTGELGEKITDTFSRFYIGENGKKWYPKWEIYDLFEIPDVLPILYEVGLIGKKDVTVEINPKFLKFFDESKTEKRLTLKQLENQLENWKTIGDIAEEIVLNYEQKRLENNGHISESEKVKRISVEYTNAGYDIESFSGHSDPDKPDMFIEVKGSSEKEFNFHWSTNEIKKAKEYGEKYWIYFVPEINIDTMNTESEIEKIQNPYNRIFKNKSFSKTVENYHIRKTGNS